MHGPLNVKKGHCHLKGYLFKLWLVNIPECDGYKQAYETASHVPLFLWEFGHAKIQHLVRYFMKPGWWRHPFQQYSALCSRRGGARCMNVMAAQSMQYCWSAWVTNVPPTPTPLLFFSVLLSLSYRFNPQPVVKLQAFWSHCMCQREVEDIVNNVNNNTESSVGGPHVHCE